jgi:hypothetical protein
MIATPRHTIQAPMKLSFFAFVLFLQMGLLSGAHAISLRVPLSMIESEVAQQLPKEKLSVKIDRIQIKLNPSIQKMQLCGRWTSKLLKGKGDFCLDTQLTWNMNLGAIEIGQFQVIKLCSSDVAEISTKAASTVRHAFQLLLNDVHVYQVPDLIGKKISRIQVQENSFKILF